MAQRTAHTTGAEEEGRDEVPGTVFFPVLEKIIVTN